jgi:fermentation-respiration switch protein FrsA (DUF1100 family)
MSAILGGFKVERVDVRSLLPRRAIAWQAVICLVIALMIAGFVLAAMVGRTMLHVPRKHAPPSIAALEAAIIANDGVELRGSWFGQGAGSLGCVIILHGLGESRAAAIGYAQMFQRAAYSVLTPDSRGHGESRGKYVTYGLLEKGDVKQWTSWMREQGCKRIYGLGESLGAVVLLQSLPITPEFRAVVAESSFAEFRTYRIQRLQLRTHSAFLASIAVDLGLAYARIVDHIDLTGISPRQSISSTSTPVLLIEDMKDDNTSPADSQLLASAVRGAHELWLVPNAGHTGAASAAPDEFRRRVLEWFASH